MGDVGVSVGDVGKAAAGAVHHFVADVDAVDLAKVNRHRTEQAAGPAADLQGPAAAGIFAGGEAAQFPLQGMDDFSGCGLKLVVLLLPPAEGDVVVGIFAGAGIPVLAHFFDDVGVGVGHVSWVGGGRYCR